MKDEEDARFVLAAAEDVGRAMVEAAADELSVVVATARRESVMEAEAELAGSTEVDGTAVVPGVWLEVERVLVTKAESATELDELWEELATPVELEDSTATGMLVSAAGAVDELESC